MHSCPTSRLIRLVSETLKQSGDDDASTAITALLFTAAALAGESGVDRAHFVETASDAFCYAPDVVPGALADRPN